MRGRRWRHVFICIFIYLLLFFFYDHERPRGRDLGSVANHTATFFFFFQKHRRKANILDSSAADCLRAPLRRECERCGFKKIKSRVVFFYVSRVALKLSDTESERESERES